MRIVIRQVPAARIVLAAVLILIVLAPSARALQAGSGAELYQQLRAFDLSGGVNPVDGLAVSFNRVELTFTGTFYFEAPVAGEVRGAVFIGNGQFRKTPATVRERQETGLVLNTDIVESDFSTAVLRFTDDTFDAIGPATQEGEPSGRARDLAREFEPRFVRESGANVSARLAVSILNGEDPGFFLAEFDGGERGRFSLLLDRQARIPAAHFGIDGGEKGLVFANERWTWLNDRRNIVWAAFYSEEDYGSSDVTYPDEYNIVDPRHYDMEVDVRNGHDRLSVKSEIEFVANTDGVWAIPLAISESLPELRDARLDRGMRLLAASYADGSPLEAIQEEWEGGATLFLADPLALGQSVSVVVEFEGRFMYDELQCSYPQDRLTWYPRHGHLTRSTFGLTVVHLESDRVVSGGQPLGTSPSENGEDRVTRFRYDEPVSTVTFAVGHFRTQFGPELIPDGGPLELHSIEESLNIFTFDESDLIEEVSAAVTQFEQWFGPYPYPRMSLTAHAVDEHFPGVASFLLVSRDYRSQFDSRAEHMAVGRELAHQWWGNLIQPASYRDDWIIEGLVEYSAILYTGIRESRADALAITRRFRRELAVPPVGPQRVMDGRIADVGPVVLGHRLNDVQVRGADEILVHGKGALIMRMLHFLLTDPSTGTTSFYQMLTDLVERHRGSSVSTQDFNTIVNEYFSGSVMASVTGQDDLNWFFQQWVYETYLPTYRLRYVIEDQPDGFAVVSGILYQEDVPESFVMPMLVQLDHEDQESAEVILLIARGPQTPFRFALSTRPGRVRLDPAMWVLSDDYESDSVELD